MMKVKQLLLTASVGLLLLLTHTAAAQTTAFTYQGKLTDSGNLANGNYDFQFKLFDALAAGNQLGTTQTVNNVTVSNGIFTVNLDFGVCAACFNGAARFLEIAVRPTGGGSFTTLSPRQPITSTPYALNAAQLGGLAASSFLQNSTSQQASSNFNISGDGTAGGTLSANFVNATTRYNLNGQTVLSAAGTNNLFAGINAGTTGSNNAFFGAFAGNGNTTGINNAFFGTNAGQANTGASQNAFFGTRAGQANTTGCCNAFFGFQAGLTNTIGVHNTFIGSGADFFFANSTGDNNTLLGALSAVLTGGVGINNATAIGSQAQVSASNSLVLGSINGVNSATADTNVGIGTTAPTARLHVNGNGLFTGNLTVNGTLTATLPGGSASYIQNSTSQQASSNFNISGTGTANVLNAAMHYSLAGLRAFTVNGAYNDAFTIFTATNTFAGDGAGVNTTPSGTLNNSSGKFNSFYGAGAGQANTTGGANAFFGTQAGQFNTTGGLNAFFGVLAGARNTTGSNNAFFGYVAGSSNTTGDINAFFGEAAGIDNTTGRQNSFFGYQTGFNNTTGNRNSFFGQGAGSNNTIGMQNTFIGIFADFNTSSPTGDNNTLLGYSTNVNSGVSNGTAIGANASVTQNNSLVLGGITGVNGGTDATVGIGTTAPGAVLDVQRDGGTIPETARFTTYGSDNKIFSRASGGTRAVPTATTSGRNLLQLGAIGHDGTQFVSLPKATILMSAAEAWTPAANGTLMRFNTTANGTTTSLTRLFINDDGNVGIGTISPQDKLHVAADIRVGTGTTGCVKDANGSVIAGSCSSDARLKRDITPFPHLLDKLVQLQPVQFFWRSEEFKERHFGIKPSFGLIAQEVEKVLPELVSEDAQGYKAVNYSKLPLLSLQAIKELKAENDSLKQRLSEQQALNSTQQQQLNQQRTQLAIQQQQLSQQQQQLSQQQQEIEAVKKLLCQSQPQADLCKTKALK